MTENDNNNKLAVQGLHLSYGDNAILKGVSMWLRQGEVVSLLGPSGSGKTTLLRAVAGLEAPKQGTIRIEDKPVFDGAQKLEVPAERRNLGLVFQSYALWPHRTVFDNVAYGLRVRGTGRSDIAERVAAVLEGVGLGELGGRYPHQLSGGQQQRVALARAFAYSPPVILLDEPLSNLDAKLREESRIWVRTLIKRLGLTAVFVTHDQVEAMAIADEIVLLEAGRIVQSGSPQALYDEPRSLFAAEFMGSNSALNGRVLAAGGERGRLEFAGFRLAGLRRGETPAGAEASAVIRVERTRLAT